MSQRVVRELIDDLDGGPADETVNLALDNRAYELDLSRDNAGELRDSLAKYLAVARRVNTTPRATRTSSSGSNGVRRSKAQLRAIRDWAKAKGYPVADRGRISAEVQAKFDAAHPAGQHPAQEELAPAPQPAMTVGWH